MPLDEDMLQMDVRGIKAALVEIAAELKRLVDLIEKMPRRYAA